MKMFIKHVFFILILIVSLVFVFYSSGKFMLFMSVPSKQMTSNTNDSIFLSLLIDSFLLSTFMLQHSIMALPKYNQYLEKINVSVLSRSIYNLFTSLALLALVKFWVTTTEILIWNIDVNNSVVYYLFCAIQLFAWSVIYTGCLFMDVPEILGVKQVYYSIRKMPNPMYLKSPDLQRLYGHMRHPSFTAFSIILWVYPIMSLDRCLLASISTAYMYFTWKTDKNDYHYQKVQYNRKSQELSKLY